MPADRPRFSELLADRRQRLGLSLQQASQVLRLKPQVLAAFETGDFEQMPKSGYAQGMLSSYARYLGLNPKQVTDQYTADLDAYLRSGGGRMNRGTVVTRETSPGGVSAPMPRIEGARGLLPTSGGLAGDYGAFATTTTVHRGSAGTGDRGISVVRSWEQDTGVTDSYRTRDASRNVERRYTTRTPSAASRPRSSRASSRASGRAAMGDSRIYQTRGRDQVMTRRVGRNDYVDDLHYGSARPYEAASTTSGRVRSRDIASTRRPNVQRRRSAGPVQPTRHGGVVGVIEAFFSDTRRAVMTIVAIAAVVLAVFLVSSIRGCIANQSSTGRTIEVTPTETSTSGNDTSQGDTKAADEQALADAAATKQKSAVPAETIVVVSVGDGMVSWLDIQADGTSVIAETVTGPWEQSFTVADSITIEADDTSSVTVTENGELRQFEARAPGVYTMTIENAAKAAAAAEGGTAAATSTTSATSTQTGATTAAGGQVASSGAAAQTYDESDYG